MFRHLNTLFEAFSPVKLTLLCLILVGAIGYCDYATGYEMSFSAIYLLPVCLASWYSGKRLGLTISIVAAIIWLVADYTSGSQYSQTWIYYWNGTIRLIFFSVTAHLISSLKEHINYEATLARLDALTGLKNARSFMEEAKLLFNLATRHHDAIVLAYLDLDNFKTINDMMGHAEGDLVLQTVGRTLSFAGRSTDIIGRLGGDEFAIILSNTGLSGAQVYFDRLHQLLLQAMRDRGWPVGFSIGVAVFPVAPANENEAIKYADDLMYQVKNTHKNRVIYEVINITERSARQIAAMDSSPALGSPY
jgi:diguanylate cyclase (GGDEF)-like protein